MTGRFSIDVSSWLSGCQGQDEVRKTACLLRITTGDRVITRAEDAWSKSVQQFATVSAYPLALWFAASWWRLRWESWPFRGNPDVSWRMSHEMPAAGYGFLWPPVTLESDGEQVNILCRPSNPLTEQPLRYLADFQETTQVSVLEKAIDKFVGLVLARLDAVGMEGTHLHHLWGEIRQERADPGLARSRRLEAKLGFEPDEAPDHLMNRLESLSSNAGPAAVEELAPICAGPQPEETLAQIEEFAEQTGSEAHVRMPVSS